MSSAVLEFTQPAHQFREVSHDFLQGWLTETIRDRPGESWSRVLSLKGGLFLTGIPHNAMARRTSRPKSHRGQRAGGAGRAKEGLAIAVRNNRVFGPVCGQPSVLGWRGRLRVANAKARLEQLS